MSSSIYITVYTFLTTLLLFNTTTATDPGRCPIDAHRMGQSGSDTQTPLQTVSGWLPVEANTP